VIVSRKRDEAERLQRVGDRRQHLRTSQNRTGSGQEHQFDLRSLYDRLRKRQQTTGERDYLEIRLDALAIREPKHSRSGFFKACARDAPRRAGLGEATHKLDISMQRQWLLREDYRSASLDLVTSFGANVAPCASPERSFSDMAK